MDDFTQVTDPEQLETAISESTDIITPLVEKGRKGEILTPEERTALVEAGDRRDAAQAQVQALADAAAADAAEQEALLTRFAEPEAVEAPAEEIPAEVAPVAEVPAEPAPAEPVAEEAPVSEAIAAAGGRPAPARRPVPHPAAPVESGLVDTRGTQVAIVASSALANIGQGTTVELAQVGEMLGAAALSYSAPTGTGDGTHNRDLRKTPIAQFRITRDEAHTLTGDPDKDMELVSAAIDPNRLEGENGVRGLVAAGGWCAPSEILYGIPVVGESLDGLLSGPEMNAARGGVKSTLGPDFATLYAAIGFEQTETQAIAGDTKDCYEIDCPSFTETRMDVKGVCLMVPILTEAGYPEYVERITSGALVVHAHKMNAYRLAKQEAASTPVTALDLGSTAESTLHSLELRAEFTRQKYRMAFDEAMEVVLPHWVRPYVREDLSRRMGLDPRNPIMDAVLDAHFRARHLNVQWVYDWQTFADPMSSAPTTFKAQIYPAGTFLTLTKDVISLSSVYDAASLATNTYTGTFTEEGIGVRKMKGISEVVTIALCQAGRVGAANITCP